MTRGIDLALKFVGNSASLGISFGNWDEGQITLACRIAIAILPGSPPRTVCASVAQLAELRFCKPEVVGSSPTAS